MNKKDDPDMEHGCTYGGTRGEPMDPIVVELHEQLLREIRRLEKMVSSATGALFRPGGYRTGLLWIGTRDKHGERSEFSKRLAKARALFAALIALEDKAGVEQPPLGGPYGKEADYTVDDD